ncbi:hypothetical protein AAMO2058_001498500 [Amorphochlora amoebiformis]
MQGHIARPSGLWAPVDIAVVSPNEDSELEPKAYRTSLRDFKNTLQRAEVVGNFTLRDVIDNKLDKPLDLQTFGKYCESEFNEEHLAFYLLVSKFKQLKPTGEEYFNTLHKFRDLYIKVGSDSQVNIRYNITKHINIIRESKQGPDYTIFDAAQSEVFKLLENDVFKRFKDIVSLQAQIREARAQALWCCFRKETPDAKAFFTYPNPVDSSHARLIRGITGALLMVGCVEYGLVRTNYIFLATLASWMLRVISGPRLDPIWFFAIFVLDPIFVQWLQLISARYVTNKARRFADVMGVANMSLYIVPSFFPGPVSDPLVYIMAGVYSLGAWVHCFSPDW